MKASRDGYVEVAVLLAAIFAGLIPLASLSAHDQESPATGEKSLLSLSDLEELARRSNPTLVQAAASVSGSEHGRRFITVSLRNGNTAPEPTAAGIGETPQGHYRWSTSGRAWSENNPPSPEPATPFVSGRNKCSGYSTCTIYSPCGTAVMPAAERSMDSMTYFR